MDENRRWDVEKVLHAIDQMEKEDIKEFVKTLCESMNVLKNTADLLEEKLAKANELIQSQRETIKDKKRINR